LPNPDPTAKLILHVRHSPASTVLNVDLNLVRKYDRPTPRYTSYPTAVHFSDNADHAALEAEIAACNRDASEPLSLYVHLPFCETLCWFCGCTTVITTNHGRADTYLDVLELECARAARDLHPGRSACQVHLGGGSPTFLSPTQLERLGEMLHRHFRIAADSESSVEVDPRRLSRDHLAALARHGFNRASLGVQDVDPKVQEAIHRIQPLEQTEQCIRWLRELGFGSINIDLIYGLPYQTPESFARTLESVLPLQPDRFAVFSYAHVPWMKPAQKILENTKALPPPEVKLQLLKQVVETLTSAGYDYIGMDHFARKDDELAVAAREGTLTRNFQGYSTRAGAEIVALGMSSISQTRRSYRQNIKELTAWEQALKEERRPWARGIILSDDDVRRRHLIHAVMCKGGFNLAATSAELGCDVSSTYAAELEALGELAEDGLVERTPTDIRVTEAGRLFLRNIAAVFDSYLAKAPGRHSRAV
jgi:oxygen-independent coproporphyrinogen-3 oxidase